MDITYYLPETQRILSFFTGAGFLDEGIERTGVQLRTIAAVEKEAFAIGNLARKVEVSQLAPFPIYTDIKTFDGSHFYGKIHGIIGGYPCTPFSVAGNMHGIESKQFLWDNIFKAVQTVRPLWVFFENVPGHYKMGFDKVITDLEGAGYAVEVGFYSAAETGGQIVRERFFISGVARPYREVLRRKFRSLQEKKDRKRTKNDQSYETRDPGNAVSISQIGRIESQYEHDRLITGAEIESILGMSANGHNYREDFIQLLGNGVYPPTAKLAFESLWTKQITTQ